MSGSFLPALFGGMMIGLAAGGLRLATGRVAGISGIYRGAVTGPDRTWRLAFLGGLLSAGALVAWLGGRGSPAIALIPLPVLLIGGLLVGIGAGLGGGCTSGHGVCGLARLSRRSIVAVPIFMATAMLTVLVVPR